MKTTSFFLLITLVFTFFSCATDADDGFSVDSFFPLKVGDRFVYKAIHLDSALTTYKSEIEVKTLGIKDTLGKKYYILENYLIRPGIRETTYVRNEGKNIYFLGANTENLVYSFNPPNDSINDIHYFNSNSDSDLVVKRIEVNKDSFVFQYRTGIYDFCDCLVEEKFIKDKGRNDIILYTSVGYAHYQLIKKY